MHKPKLDTGEANPYYVTDLPIDPAGVKQGIGKGAENHHPGKLAYFHHLREIKTGQLTETTVPSTILCAVPSTYIFATVSPTSSFLFSSSHHQI